MDEAQRMVTAFHATIPPTLREIDLALACLESDAPFPNPPLEADLRRSRGQLLEVQEEFQWLCPAAFADIGVD